MIKANFKAPKLWGIVVLLLNIFQGLAIVTLYLFSQAENPVVLGLSLQGLIITVGTLGCLAVLSLILFLITKNSKPTTAKIQKVLPKHFTLFEVLISAILIILLILFALLIQKNLIHSIKIWLPFSWISLIIMEIFIFLTYFKQSQHTADVIKKPSVKFEILIGLFMIILGGIFGFLIRYYGNFVDEGDHLAVGKLISEGWVLYKDVFSHHPPLVYYWISGLIKLFGCNIGIIRLSLVFLWVTVFGITARLTKKYITFGILSILWAGSSYFYLSNLLNYHPFAGIFIVASAAMVIFYKPDEKHQIINNIWLGLTMGLALLSNFQLIWAISILMFGYCVFRVMRKEKAVKPLIRDLSIILGCIAGIMLVFLLHLVITNSLKEAYDGIYVFNTDIYSKYTPTQINQLPAIFKQLKTGLGITNFLTGNNELIQELIPKDYSKQIDYWFFGGFMYRLGIIVFCFLWLIKKKPIMAVWFYIFSASLLTRHEAGLHAVPFIMFALFTLSALVTERQEITYKNKYSASFAAFGLSIIKLTLIFMMLIFSANIYLTNYKYRHAWQYEVKFSGFEEAAGYLKTFECGMEKTKYLVYPLDPLLYFMLDREPASKYIFFAPWVADVGQQELLENLKTEPYVIVKLDMDGNLLGYSAEDFLKDIKAYLDQDYVIVADGVWQSPALYSYCHK